MRLKFFADHCVSNKIANSLRPEVTPHILARLTELITAHGEMKFFKGKPFVIETHRIRI